MVTRRLCVIYVREHNVSRYDYTAYMTLDVRKTQLNSIAQLWKYNYFEIDKCIYHLMFQAHSASLNLSYAGLLASGAALPVTTGLKHKHTTSRNEQNQIKVLDWDFITVYLCLWGRAGVI